MRAMLAFYMDHHIHAAITHVMTADEMRNTVVFLPL